MEAAGIGRGPGGPPVPGGAPVRGGALEPVGRGRRRADRIGRASLAAATMVALAPLILILYMLVEKGVGAIDLGFFAEDPTGNFLGDAGGVKSALLGTIEIVAFASALAIPIGLGLALYLIEYGRDGRLAGAVRFLIDVMTGVPSIVFGLFVYITLVLGGVGGSSFAGWKGSVALFLLMLPVVTRSAEVVLKTVPDSLREGALALGAPRWKVVAKVVLPTAAPGLLTGFLLAIARAAGETAPLLYTATIVTGSTADLNGPMNSLPMQIFQDLKQADQELVARAWGSALTLVALILLLTLAARYIQRRTNARGGA